MARTPPALYHDRYRVCRKSEALRAWLINSRTATSIGRDSTVSSLNANGLKKEGRDGVDKKRGSTEPDMPRLLQAGKKE